MLHREGSLIGVQNTPVAGYSGHIRKVTQYSRPDVVEVEFSISYRIMKWAEVTRFGVYRPTLAPGDLLGR